MKKLFVLAVIAACVFTVFNVSAQTTAPKPKAPRPSPPDTVKGTTKSGVDITIAYSQPSINDRTIGKEIAPFDGKVWRTGANEATTIEFSKAVKFEGKDLPAGKYGLYSIPGEKQWVIIINSVWKIWGLNYTKDEATGSKTDIFRVPVKTHKTSDFVEKLQFQIDESGKVSFMWGNYVVSFNVK